MYYFHLFGPLAFVEGSPLSHRALAVRKQGESSGNGSASQAALLPGWSQEPLSLNVICASWPWLPLSWSPFLGCPMNANS